jgi:Mor family transcriptional regulator
MAGSEEDFVTRLGECMAKHAGREMIERVTESMDYTLELRGIASPDRCALVELVKSIILEYRGEKLTIPKNFDEENKRQQIIKCIRAEYTGRNMQEIIDRYGVSSTTVWRYCGKNNPT